MRPKIGDVVNVHRLVLRNWCGALGYVFNDYGDGVQVIFENGEYDGFSLVARMCCMDPEGKSKQGLIEFDYFLEVVGEGAPFIEPYQFTNVMKLSADFKKGVFDRVLKHKNYTPIAEVK